MFFVQLFSEKKKILLIRFREKFWRVLVANCAKEKLNWGEVRERSPELSVNVLHRQKLRFHENTQDSCNACSVMSMIWQAENNLNRCREVSSDDCLGCLDQIKSIRLTSKVIGKAAEFDNQWIYHVASRLAKPADLMTCFNAALYHDTQFPANKWLTSNSCSENCHRFIDTNSIIT